MNSIFPPQYSFFEKVIHRITGELRRLYEITHPGCIPITKRIVDPNLTSDIIYNHMISDSPCMIARFGSVELYSVTNYLGVQKGWSGARDFIRAKQDPWWWIAKRIYELQNNAGFFPLEKNLVERFCNLVLEDTKSLDVLASWINRESLIEDKLQHCQKIFLPHLEPYYASIPWTRALAGKKVLVVHPFANKICRQYETNREKLFDNPMILPEFNLQVLPAVQSMGGETNGFSTWFEALEYMKTEMDKIDYDICIIGCGAYGFHLAAHAKRMGKKAVHLGGATQLLFGIKGNRWEDPMYGVKEWGLPYAFYTNMFNEYWVKPGEEGRPQNAEQVEGACYW